MALTQRTASALIIVTAALAAVASGYFALLVPILSLGLSPSDTTRSLESVTMTGPQIYTVGWLLWSVFCLYFVLHRSKFSEAWERRGRHRYISVIGCSLVAYGLVVTASWAPYFAIGWPLERIVPAELRGPAEGDLFRAWWVSGALAFAAALVLGAVGYLIDRTRGMAPRLDNRRPPLPACPVPS